MEVKFGMFSYTFIINFVYESKECSGEFARLYRPARAVCAQNCGRYQYLICWISYTNEPRHVIANNVPTDEPVQTPFKL